MDNKQDFTSGSIFGKMMQFMAPILGAQILQAMYGAVDMLVVGNFGTNAGISGVSTGSSIMNLVTFVISQLAAGVMILIGRYLGERKNERIGKLIGGAVAFFLAVSAALTVALIVFARQIAVIMQAPAEAVELTAQYIRICGVGCVFIVFYNLISCIFRGLGNSRLPLLFVGIACVVNIVGDLVLVALLDMNVAGAAIATVGAQAVSVVLSLIIIRRQKLPFEMSLKDIRLGGEVRGFVKLGAPLALQELLTNVSFLAICAFINRLGLDASNGYGIAQKIQSFVMLVPSSIMQCMASFVAQNVGAGGCVIVGRRADQVLSSRENLLRVFVTAPVEDRARRVARRDDLTLEKARALVRKADRERAEYYNSLSEGRWGEAASYDLCLDTRRFGADGVVELIVSAAKKI